MFRDLRSIFRIKAVLSCFLLSVSLRVVLLFFLPETPSQFAPDEGTYGSLAEYVSTGKSVNEFPAFGPDLYNSSRTFILPSTLLVKVGFSGLASVRIVSSIFGLLSSIALVLCLSHFNSIKNQSRVPMNRKAILILIIFTFLPSNFLWSVVGLRESTSQLFILLSFYFICKALATSDKRRLLYSLFASLSVMLSFGGRQETAMIFGCVFAISLLTTSFRKHLGLPSMAIIFGLILGNAYTAVPQITANSSVIGSPTNSSAMDSPTATNNSSKSRPVNILEVQSQQISANIKSKISTVLQVAGTRNTNSLNANSALPMTNCVDQASDLFLYIKCNLKEMPYRLFSVLFRPFPFIDQGSTFSLFASLENIVWLALWVIIFLLLPKIRTTIERSLLLYLFLFAVAMSLYEGNLGTAFRHKSSTLWVIMMILFVTNFENFAPKFKLRFKK